MQVYGVSAISLECNSINPCKKKKKIEFIFVQNLELFEIDTSDHEFSIIIYIKIKHKIYLIFDYENK